MIKRCLVLSLLAASGLAQAQFYGHQAPTNHVAKEVAAEQDAEEAPVALPLPPVETALIPFFVSAASPHKFLIDGNSLAIEQEGVIRYTLVILTASGAQNISHEGIRCSTAERRTYAFGKSNGEWTRTRSAEWLKIREAQVNRQHAALYQEYFCPGGVIVSSIDEARRLLRTGGDKVGGTPGR